MVDAVDDCVSLMRKLIRHVNLHLCPSATPSRPNLRLARVINVHSDARNGGHNSGLDQHVTTYASTGQQIRTAVTDSSLQSALLQQMTSLRDIIARMC